MLILPICDRSAVVVARRVLPIYDRSAVGGFDCRTGATNLRPFAVLGYKLREWCGQSATLLRLGKLAYWDGTQKTPKTAKKGKKEIITL